MTYDPKTYWPRRARLQGETYVALGGRRGSYIEQTLAVRDWFLSAATDDVRILMRTGILDFGCGLGRFRDFLAGQYPLYTGYDFPGILDHPDQKIASQERWRVPFDQTTGNVRQRMEVDLAAFFAFQHVPDDEVIRRLGRRIGRRVPPTYTSRESLGRPGVCWIVDWNPKPGATPGPHMHPRTPKRVAKLLGGELYVGPTPILDDHLAYVVVLREQSGWVDTSDPDPFYPIFDDGHDR